MGEELAKGKAVVCACQGIGQKIDRDERFRLKLENTEGGGKVWLKERRQQPTPKEWKMGRIRWHTLKEIAEEPKGVYNAK